MHLLFNETELVLQPTDETCNKSEPLLLEELEKSSGQPEDFKPRRLSVNRSQSCIDERHRSTTRVERKSSVYESITGDYRRLSTSLIHELIAHRPASVNARDLVLRYCNQTEPSSFDAVYADHRNCRKVGEGVYSEVFMTKCMETGQPVVLKIVPIEGGVRVNGERQKRFDEILSEIVIATKLSDLRSDRQFMTDGFVELLQLRCVQGKYPDHLVDLWELYRENSGTDNDHPEIFDHNQLYIVFELTNVGQDLEAFQFQNAAQSYSAFLQIAITLAIAEKRFAFEHRDLHWGNILLSATDEKLVTYYLDGEPITIATHGVRATVIDFTLSRICVDGLVYCNDLAEDRQLFVAGGDYQFDIYRFMRERLQNCWQRFEPFTNVLWLHYAIDKMISGARYKSTKNKKHRAAIDQLMQLRDELLNYGSAAEFVQAAFTEIH